MILYESISLIRYRERGHESAFMATIESHTLCDTFVSESLSYTQ